MKKRSKMIISKRSKRNGGWSVTKETYKLHVSQNRRIRKSRKEIVKPDLDAIMEIEIGKP